MRTLNRQATRATSFLPWLSWVLLASAIIFISFAVKVESKPQKIARGPAAEKATTVRLSWNR